MRVARFTLFRHGRRGWARPTAARRNRRMWAPRGRALSGGGDGPKSHGGLGGPGRNRVCTFSIAAIGRAGGWAKAAAMNRQERIGHEKIDLGRPVSAGRRRAVAEFLSPRAPALATASPRTALGYLTLCHPIPSPSRPKRSSAPRATPNSIVQSMPPWPTSRSIRSWPPTRRPAAVPNSAGC